MWQRWKIKGSARRYQANANKRKTDMATLISYKVEFKVKTLYRIESIIAAAKSLQSCPTLCDPIDSSPPDSSIPGILQARILEWVAISFSNTCCRFSCVQRCATLWTAAHQASLGKNTGVGCHSFLRKHHYVEVKNLIKEFSAPGVGDGHRSLVCSSPWVTKSQTWLSNWTELNWYAPKSGS